MDPKVTTGLAGGLDSVNLIRQQRDAAADRGVLVIERAVQGHQHLKTIHSALQKEHDHCLVAGRGSCACRWRRWPYTASHRMAQGVELRRQHHELLCVLPAIPLVSGLHGPLVLQTPPGQQQVQLHQRLAHRAARLREIEAARGAARHFDPKALIAVRQPSIDEGAHAIGEGQRVGRRVDLELRSNESVWEAIRPKLRKVEVEDRG
mmetsp:Transcript_14137/g.33706  ORF Transcript_14137/g.33706 Transcript_14137/m.33706 type:complete len:206 (-) Transcript_14137:2890-3507(-)